MSEEKGDLCQLKWLSSPRIKKKIKSSGELNKPDGREKLLIWVSELDTAVIISHKAPCNK